VGLPERRARGDHLRHLHERHHSLLYARASGGGVQDDGSAPLRSALESARETFAGDLAHASTDEVEGEPNELDIDARDGGGSGNNRLVRPRRGLRVLE
jgi:hypothetical protein